MPVMKTKMPLLGAGWQSVVVTWWTTVVKPGFCAAAQGGAQHRRRPAGGGHRATPGQAMAAAAYDELCHNALHAHELLLLEGHERFGLIQRLQVLPLRAVERRVVMRREGRANLCAKGVRRQGWQ